MACSGTLSAPTKQFDIAHPDPEKLGMPLRHWCTEGDHPGKSLLHQRQLTAVKASLADLIMPDWFQHLAKNVIMSCNGFKHQGTAWGEQDDLDPYVLHITVSKGGSYNIMVIADRNDVCATTLCPKQVKYILEEPEDPPQPFPSPDKCTTDIHTKAGSRRG